ncbi:MAG: hypothetical protein LBF67_04680 [Prevotellaceae bacterium]|jgi:hypothetical protein|nr:hypothetical protein [Prevotellaceae bacterium]
MKTKNSPLGEAPEKRYAMIQLDLYQLCSFGMKCSELGVALFLKLLDERGAVTVDPRCDSISQREAYRLFGALRVLRWERDGLVKPARGNAGKNSKLRYSYADLLFLDMAESPQMRDALTAQPQTSKGDLARFLAADLFKEADEVTVTQSVSKAHPDGGEAEHTVTAVIDGEAYTATARSAGRCLIDIADAFRRAKEAATSKAKRHEK